MVTFEVPESPVRSQRSTRNQTALYSSRYHPMDEITRPTLTQKLRGGKRSARQLRTSPQTPSPESLSEDILNVVSPSSAHDVPLPSSSAHRRSQRASANVTPGAYNAKFHPMDARLRPVRGAKTLAKRAADLLVLPDDGSSPSKRRRILSDEEPTELSPADVESEDVDDRVSEIDTAGGFEHLFATFSGSPSDDELAQPNPAPADTDPLDDQASDFGIGDNFAHAIGTASLLDPPYAYQASFQSFVALHDVAPIEIQARVLSSPILPSSGSQVIEPHVDATCPSHSPDPVELEMYDADDESDWSLIDGPAVSTNYNAESDTTSKFSNRSETSSFGPSRKGLVYETINTKEFLVEPDNPWLQQPKSIFRHMTLLDRRLYSLQGGQKNDGAKMPLVWEEVITKLVESGDVIVNRGDMLAVKGGRLVVKGDDVATSDKFATFADFERWGGVPALVARYEILCEIVRGSNLRAE